ncbi:hypothetical protein Y094_20790 [Salmonella enterica subsp. enterica serovar Tennessee]|nr:hypothetical protein Y094_20790 [Salmonella enterica subsp. enterica serovar Tennessee]
MRVGILFPVVIFITAILFLVMVFYLAVTPRREHNHEENNDGVDGHRANCGGGYRTGLVVNSF